MPQIKATQGDTAEQIQKRFQLTPDQFTELNPNLSGGLTVGQSINIPDAPSDIPLPISDSPIQQAQEEVGGNFGGLFKVPTGSEGPGGPVSDVFTAEGEKLEEGDARLAGVNILGLPEGQAPEGFQSEFKEVSKFEQGFNQAKDAGTIVPDGATGEQGLVDQFSTTTFGAGAAFIQNDPFISNLIQTYRDFVETSNQRATLTETYQQLVKDSGLEDLDLELVDMKNVIEGTEDDIRTEVTKAGGFATESQVLALTNSRNKQLIKNYNRLIDLRNSKQQYLQTVIGLEAQDRAAADRQFDTMFNMTAQIAEMGQRMQRNAFDRLVNLQNTIGLDGIFQSVQGDPNAVRLVEQTLGMTPGALQIGASQAVQARADEAAATALDTRLTESQLATQAAQRANIFSQIAERTPEEGADVDEGARLADLDRIDKITGLQTHKGLNNAVGTGGKIRGFFTRRAPLTDVKDEFIGSVDQIVDQLSLGTLIEAKSRGATFGALSDTEMRILRSAATKIGGWRVTNDEDETIGYKISHSAFKKELDTIRNMTARAYVLSGFAPEDVGGQVLDDGTVWIQNTDGTLFQLTR